MPQGLILLTYKCYIPQPNDLLFCRKFPILIFTLDEPRFNWYLNHSFDLVSH